ncbi:Hsp20/alpha crystallin family protein [Cohnella sp. REN36]|uniref:Hsp20/alpha crystallin family protein n=1 Tax=Cohnella sp. REN36 TaxID=2887347 RepID=UPI001D134991|nr:Hsp20/alpha crystallin family protein [Cohnella sp. REN36]MCC3373110.1 Hsp20/alpha crystallin family protein [Cohnella sp. REN36]
MDDWQQSQDWQKFQKNVLKHVPGIGKDGNGKEIEQLVQRTIRNFMPKMLRQPGLGMHPYAGRGVDYELFETQRSIFVQCRLQTDVVPGDLRLYVSRTKLKIEAEGRVELVALPGEVNTSRTTASFANGILEVRMPKANETDHYREIFIRDP